MHKLVNQTNKILLILALFFSSVVSIADETWIINHKDADLRAYVEQMALISGKTFIIDPTLKGKITIISSEPSTKSQAFDIFMSILDIYGFSAVPNGDVVQIIKQADIKSKGSGVDATPLFGEQEIMTRVIFVKNRSVNELVPLLRPMVAKYGHLAGVNSANALIISDTTANIQRMEALIATLDILNSEEIEVITLKEAWVGNIVGLLERLVPEEVAAANERSAGSGKIRVVADERSNSIILKGEAAFRERIRLLIETLDKPSTQNSASKVVFLNNADAVKLAALLNGFTGALAQSNGNAADDKPVSPSAILADEDLNALVIRAEPEVMVEIESVIASLDIARAQVLIEAAIVEVSGNVSEMFGIQWGGNPGAGPVAAVSQFNESGATISGLASSVVTGGMPAIGNGLSLGMLSSGLSFGAIIQALESQSNANLLSTPSIMTLDNNEASLLVGGTVPFRTTSQQSGSGNPFETITRQDVGTTLKVTPHIQKDGYVSLDVEQKTESVIPRSDDGAVDVQTSKREITTKVLVEGGQTIVLGGLIKEDVSQGVSKIPVLGNLPGIGVLFRSNFEKRTKVNLLVFIRPTIVREKSQAISAEKFQGIWELRLDGEAGVPVFEQLFSGQR
jgi:general secretion pathway protein D